MKVLVTLPNGRTTYCVECYQKAAIGREVLEKVCQEQNILCETEYFGLVYNPRRSSTERIPSPSADHPSLITQTLAAATASDPTDSPARSSLAFTSNQQTAPLQDSTTNDFEAAPKVRQWLNLRNPLGRCDGGFLSLALRVKFWVPVHLILQESVRNLFYMEARQELLENRIHANDWSSLIQLVALMAHADGVRFNSDCLLESSRVQVVNSNSFKIKSSSSLVVAHKDPFQRRRASKRKSSEPAVDSEASVPASPLSVYEPYLVIRPKNKTTTMSPEQLLVAIAEEHQKLAKQSQRSAKYWFLREFGSLKGFGEERFIVPRVDLDGVNSQVELSVGPEGVGILNSARGEQRQDIPFSAIQRASAKNRTFRLKYWNQANKEDELVLKMSPTLCAALYRAVTEKHDFYSCETVRSDVTTQFIRDFKGTFLSIFNEDTELGKKYVFDIQRTCREVHDHARRYLHKNGILLAGPAEDPTCENDVDPLDEGVEKRIQAEVTKQLAEVVCCRICMDKTIDAMFPSCGHVVSCMDCAKKCDRCPICRTEVSSICKLFLPSELRTARTK